MTKYQSLVYKVIPNSKFKRTTLSLLFISELSERKATVRSLLSLMLVDRSLGYDSKQKIVGELDNLYGARLSSKCLSYGQAHVLELSTAVLNHHYSDENIIDNQISFMKELVYHPLLSETLLKEAKQNLKETILRIQDNPSEYALNEAYRVAGVGYPLGISSIGELNLIDEIELAEIEVEYQSLLDNDNKVIVAIGDEEESLVTKLQDAFSFKQPKHNYPTHYLFPTVEVKEARIFKNVEQANLVVIYNTHTSVIARDYWPMRVANALFGQVAVSLLFQEVREKRSLAYSIYSQINWFDGILYVNTGIEQTKIKEVIELIEEQRQIIVKGDFSLELLEVTKKMLINAMLSGLDSPNSLVSLVYQNVLLNRDLDIETIVEQIKTVTKEEVMEAFAKLELNTIFTIEKEEENAENS